MATRARSKSGFTALTVAGGSLYSRATSAGVLVLAARHLNLSDFGSYAALFGVSTSLASVATSTSGDVVAYWSRSRPNIAARAARYGALALGSLASLSIYLAWRGPRYWALTLLVVTLTVATAVNLASMQILRGSRHLIGASIVGFYIPSSCQGLFVLLGLHSRTTLVTVLLLATLGTSAAGMASALCLGRATGSVTPIAYRMRRRFMLASFSGGLMWFVVSQVDVLSLSFIKGSAAAGSYVPEMRLFEALTAWGVAFSFMSTRAIIGRDPADQVDLLSRLRVWAVACYIVSAAPFAVAGHVLLKILFGSEAHWSTWLAIVFAAGYGLNVATAVVLQFIVANSLTRRLLAVTLPGIGLSLCAIPLLTAVLGATGAGIGNAVAYGGVSLFANIQFFRAKEALHDR